MSINSNANFISPMECVAAFAPAAAPLSRARQLAAQGVCRGCGRGVWMKKKGRAGAGAGSADAVRVDMSGSTRSLREQLADARRGSEEHRVQRPVVRTKFRRKKGDVWRGGGAGRRDEAEMPDGKYVVGLDPVVYIDAYNVIGAWPRLRKHRDRSDMQAARELLVHDVAEYSHVRGWACVVVFDAHGNENGVNRSTTAQSVDVVFTGSETADSYIERRVFQACEEGQRQVWAATSDGAQRSFTEAKGAHIMSSRLFIQEMKRARRESRERVEDLRDEGAARARMLMSNVDEATRERLYELRDFLDNGGGKSKEEQLE